LLDTVYVTAKVQARAREIIAVIRPGLVDSDPIAEYSNRQN
jgi:hypothetical protein